MDMSFSLADAVPLAAPSLAAPLLDVTSLDVTPLGYPALLAALRNGGAAHLASVAVADVGAADSRAPSPAFLLASVLLGRPGWREASLALGGSFAGGFRPAHAARRKPV